MAEHVFKGGPWVITEGAYKALHRTKDNANSLFEAHLSGDWGDVCEEDRAQNDNYAKTGGMVMSVFYLGDGTKIYVISDPAYEDGTRPATTLLLPSDY